MKNAARRAWRSVLTEKRFRTAQNNPNCPKALRQFIGDTNKLREMMHAFWLWWQEQGEACQNDDSPWQEWVSTLDDPNEKHQLFCQACEAVKELPEKKPRKPYRDERPKPRTNALRL